QIDMRFLHGFSDDFQTELLANSRHDLPAFIAEPLERVRRRSSLPNASAEKTRPTLLDNFCYGEGLLAALDRARAGDDCQPAVANRRVADTNHSFIGSQVDRDQFVRLGAGENLEEDT